MVVCHCKAVTDRTIRSAVEGGAASCAEIALRCGAGSRCGGCVETIESLLAGSGCAGSPLAVRVIEEWSAAHERVA